MWLEEGEPQQNLCRGGAEGPGRAKTVNFTGHSTRELHREAAVKITEDAPQVLNRILVSTCV